MNNLGFRKYSSWLIFSGMLFLVYWLVTFITIEVFHLRIFRESITTLFKLSIIGILPLIVSLLFLGDYLTVTKKEKFLVRAARMTIFLNREMETICF